MGWDRIGLAEVGWGGIGLGGMGWDGEGLDWIGLDWCGSDWIEIVISEIDSRIAHLIRKVLLLVTITTHY